MEFQLTSESVNDTPLADQCGLAFPEGVLAFDKWTCNADGRQVVFHRPTSHHKYNASFIDFGYCFNAAEWSFPDAPLRGTYMLPVAYFEVSGWDAFEPFLSRIESVTYCDVLSLLDTVPPEWYGGDTSELEQLLETLYARRTRVRDLITDFRKSSRFPFPNWKGEHA